MQFAIVGQVCKALACLTHDHAAAQQACGLAVVPVVSLLAHPDSAVVDQACQALACLVCYCPHHQTAAAEAGAVGTLFSMVCDFQLDAPAPAQRSHQETVHLVLALLVGATQVWRVLESHCIYLPTC